MSKTDNKHNQQLSNKEYKPKEHINLNCNDSLNKNDNQHILDEEKIESKNSNEHNQQLSNKEYKQQEHINNNQHILDEEKIESKHSNNTILAKYVSIFFQLKKAFLDDDDDDDDPVNIANNPLLGDKHLKYFDIEQVKKLSLDNLSILIEKLNCNLEINKNIFPKNNFVTIKTNHNDLKIAAINNDVTEMIYNLNGSLKNEKLSYYGNLKKYPHPIVMSPAYIGFIMTGKQYLCYDDVDMVFDKPEHSTFMKPVIDTFLLMYAIKKLFKQNPNKEYNKVFDIGTGSGFIGKYVASKAYGIDPIEIILLDVDPKAIEFIKSKNVNMPIKGQNNRDIIYEYRVEDAIKYLKNMNKKTGGLIISNPPYIPTDEEIEKNVVTCGLNNFYDGIAFYPALIDAFEKLEDINSELVILVSSLSLKSKRIVYILRNIKQRGLEAQILVERELGWKADFTGNRIVRMLLANKEEIRNRKEFGELKMFVGATIPGQLRLQMANDGRRNHPCYHWQVVYVIHIKKKKFI
eukprot:97820_1